MTIDTTVNDQILGYKIVIAPATVLSPTLIRAFIVIVVEETVKIIVANIIRPENNIFKCMGFQIIIIMNSENFYFFC